MIFTSTQRKKADMKKKLQKACYVVVSLWKKDWQEQTLYIVYRVEKLGDKYNHSGDDGKEVPPVPIPNTEVKLFYAESTCRLLPGG